MTNWPPTLDELRNDLGVKPGEVRDGDDDRLGSVLAAAVAFVERVRPEFGYPGTPDVGDPVNLALTATDDEGEPANFDSVQLVIELPDGTEDVTPVVAHPPAVTGFYTYSYLAVQPGNHTARWTTTGPVSVVPQWFSVREAIGRKPPPPDLHLGTLRLAGRWHTRRRSPDGLVAMAELGMGRVPSFDPDIERLLKIGRFRGAVFA